jgi:phosphoribosylformylglycinamidine synthase
MQGLVRSCHDLSEGGLAVALAEMAMAGERGVALDPLPSDPPCIAYLFGEDQARYLLETADPATVLAAARAEGISARAVGTVGGVALTLPGAGAISVNALKTANEAWLPGYMEQN